MLEIAPILCYKNPVKNIKFQRVAESARKSAYTKEQAEKCEQYAREHNRIDIILMLNTGIRRSELLGLKWSDIDFDAKTLRVERAVTQTKGKIIIDKPKTATSVRTIPLPSDLTEYLAPIRSNPDVYIVGGKDKPQSI